MRNGTDGEGLCTADGDDSEDDTNAKSKPLLHHCLGIDKGKFTYKVYFQQIHTLVGVKVR